MNVLDRLELIREDLGLGKLAFEKSLKKSNGYFNTLRKNNSKIGLDTLQNFIYAHPQYSLEWVVTGNGEMKKKEEAVVKEEESSYNIYNTEEVMDQLKELSEKMNYIQEGIGKALIGITELNIKAEELDSKKLTKAAEDISRYLKK